jgi:hypothetical protein
MKLSSMTTIAFLLLAAASNAWADNPFIIAHPHAQEELKLSDEQKKKFLENLPDYQVEGRFSMQKVNAPGARDKFWAFLKETLTTEQFKRFQQLELQHDLTAPVSRPEIVKELKITDEQQKQLRGLIQELQKKNESLKKESGGKPQEIRRKGVRPMIIEEYDEKIEAILNDAQKKQWKEMRGKVFNIP